ncbi:MAG: hypothetical protein Q4G24_06790 [Paracoccus sp. (in: a-proteobacteria)]|uniref:hypothetical protein n=1 Tax=Paracoccus sp. TaxID=267 RepID=UPI0026E0D12F|nr:hypothetical protein [Paracoccus sp. (in: a-proteobacteria)]MDO5621159.1 hypothetical protein [Paracoccus sp. (in: a-proteobacteria)]
MEYLPLIISLLSGAAGGNIVGALAKNLNLGTAGNSIAGILGGGLGAQILGMLGAGGAAAASQSTGLDIGSIIASVAGGGAGGGALMAIIGVVRQMMNKN